MEQSSLKNRTIFCRDNIDVLKGINSNSIDLIYLDPSFSKNDVFITKKNKNIEKIKIFFIEEQQKYNRFLDENFEEIFKDNTASFSDIWTENDINQYYYTQIDKFNNKLVTYLDSIKDFSIKGGFYYLLYMTVRLIEIKRILKDTGSVYYHCDPTFSHYIKAVMDRIFGVENFRNEIVWHYQTGGVSKKRYSRKHDVLLFYTNTDQYYINFDETKIKRTEKSLKRAKNQKGARYNVEDNTKLPNDVFVDIQALNPMERERTGYPTQKPVALLERIIKISSREGDIVLDPFCGCATTCIASEKLNRKWIGID